MTTKVLWFFLIISCVNARSRVPINDISPDSSAKKLDTSDAKLDQLLRVHQGNDDIMAKLLENQQGSAPELQQQVVTNDGAISQISQNLNDDVSLIENEISSSECASLRAKINKLVDEAKNKEAENADLLANQINLQARVSELLKNQKYLNAKNAELSAKIEEQCQVETGTERPATTIQPKEEDQLTVQTFASQHNVTGDDDIMYHACMSGDVSVVRARLDMGRSTEVRHKSSKTCLHYAAQYNHVGLARLLLDRGAEIDARSSFGSPPLMFAAENGRLEVAQLLVRHGAVLSLRDNGNRTALGRARKENKQQMIAYLISQNVPE